MNNISRTWTSLGFDSFILFCHIYFSAGQVKEIKHPVEEINLKSTAAYMTQKIDFIAGGASVDTIIRTVSPIN
jgi:hypothetical protein